jgi:aromatic ring hydroxylase
MVDKKNLNKVFDLKNITQKTNKDIVEIENTKIQKSIASSSNTVELLHKKMDYEKINLIFNKSRGYKITNNNSINRSNTDLKKNTDLIQKMLPKNKKG